MMGNENKTDRLYIVKAVLGILTIIICILGLFKVIDNHICVDIALVMLAVILGAIESVRDYKKGKKAYMWIDIAAAVILIALAAESLFGIFGIIELAI